MGQPVFRGYDREALDREYDNRAKVADAAEWLARYARESERARVELLNDVLALTPETARRNSPVRLAPPRAGSLLLTVGGLEGPEYLRQSEDLAAAWRTRDFACRVAVMPGYHHFSILGELETAKSELSRALLGQMGPG